MSEDEIIEFNSLLRKEEYVLADFFADWCEPCKMLDEILEQVKSSKGDKIFIEKIDVDVSKELSQSYLVLSVPVLIFFKKGVQVWRMNGFMTASELIKALENFIDD